MAGSRIANADLLDCLDTELFVQRMMDSEERAANRDAWIVYIKSALEGLTDTRFMWIKKDGSPDLIMREYRDETFSFNSRVVMNTRCDTITKYAKSAREAEENNVRDAAPQ